MSKKDKININKKRFPIGAFVPFFELFPEEAELKTRKIMLLENMFGLG